ncbi:hypothetical protein FPHYL_13761 [Fusarium phyllophilum]|uniref:Uncharacterized protein n=1 Tax=Fusarium phyllophilum TaxID=47803 RepID=A0A8H5MLT6_9HYPO|nr:hypothetical protein FPHYL_13761 [Fusarium phyllophilum]
MAFGIYTGSWTDWSRGPILGATITLSSRDASLLLAFIAAFVTVIAARFWVIICFTVHQFLSTNGKNDGLYYQRQVILRNAKSAPAAAWLFLQQAWYWRGIATSAVTRTIPWALFCVFYFLGFAVLAVFSSQISDSASEFRLLRSPNCGIQMPLESLGKPTFDNFRASTYAKECYQNANSILCGSLSVSNLSRSNASVGCPFDKSICLDTPAFKMETNMLDSHRHFGFNDKGKNRIRYKRETVCSPLVTDGSPSFIQYVRGREARTLGWEDDVLIKYLYGKLNGGQINQTLLYNTLSGNALTGYTVWSYYYPSQDAWRPVDELLVPDTDLSLILIAPNSIVHLERNIDPVFEATAILNASGSIGYTPNRWVSPIACIDRHQICNPTNAKCTRLVGSEGILESAMGEGLDFNRVQKVTIQRLTLFLQSSTFYHTIFTRTQSFLRAQEKVSGIIGQGLPSNQWEVEMAALFDDTLANMQYQMMEYAAGSPRPDAVRVVKPWANSSGSYLDGAVWESMCDNQRTRDTQGTLNFSVLGLSLLIGLGSYIILISFVLEFFLAWIQKKLGRGLYRAKRWERDDTLQQMRLLYEIQGAGVWKGTTEDFPRTTSGDLFEHDEEFNQVRRV